MTDITLDRATGTVAEPDIRFSFGKNWTRFLSTVTDERVREAEASLTGMLERKNLVGTRFLDIGCGSGLFSLAARRLGAEVHSFDFDPRSVSAALELKRWFLPKESGWHIERGSVLDADYMKGLGAFDIVYSWGVLHHTGRMWEAMDLARNPVKPGGRLFIAIYNDTGSQSDRWRWIKRAYNRLPRPLQPPFVLAVSLPEELKLAARGLVTGRLHAYLAERRGYGRDRGMSWWHDRVDWVGGYPYETAKPEEVFDFYRDRGFTLTRMKCGGVGLGCNEFVFRRDGGDIAPRDETHDDPFPVRRGSRVAEMPLTARRSGLD